MRAAWPAVRIAVIDDLADRAHDPDLLIDHNTLLVICGAVSVFAAHDREGEPLFGASVCPD